MNEEFILALEQIADEKGISKESILEAVEAALAAAYRKDYGKSGQVIRCKIDPEKGTTKFWLVKKIVEEVEDENREILLEDAKKSIQDGSASGGEDKKAEVDGEITYELPTHEEFGRIAAQTAKQVIIQRLKEAEREVVLNEYKSKEGKMINGVVQQIEGGNIVIDLGRTNGMMFPSEQITGENYRIGQRIKVIILKVEETNKGPQILVSRAHPDLIKYLFMVEVPEIESGTVGIMGIAREAGIRTKMSVRALQEGVDPVGSCVGQRGTRVQAVLSEIGNEKIDIILWDEDSATYIENALSPAKIEEIRLDKKINNSVVYVNPENLSLAIGKNGQNVRLASKLTGWKIDILDIAQKPKEEKIKEESKDLIKEEKTGKKKKKEKKEKEKKEKKKSEKKETAKAKKSIQDGPVSNGEVKKTKIKNNKKNEETA